MSSLGNWVNGNDASVCSDQSGFAGYAAWNEWEASQRDLFVLDHTGDVALYQNVSSGLPDNLNELVMQLISQIPDCDSDLTCGEALTCVDGLLYPTTCGPDNCDEPIDLVCGEALTCVDGLLYPTTCGPENCDEPIDTCSDDVCEDGEFDNSNPCNPKECYDGQWVELIIDCAEWFGVPCEGGVYVAPPEGVCCSTCVQFGDVNQDEVLNVIDIVQIVNIILNNDYDAVADVNEDGLVNVIDVVVVVNILLGGLP